MPLHSTAPFPQFACPIPVPRNLKTTRPKRPSIFRNSKASASAPSGRKLPNRRPRPIGNGQVEGDREELHAQIVAREELLLTETAVRSGRIVDLRARAARLRARKVAEARVRKGAAPAAGAISKGRARLRRLSGPMRALSSTFASTPTTIAFRPSSRRCAGTT